MSWNLNVNELPDSENSFEPIPAGEYTVITEKAELKETKSGTGEYISVQFRVVEGEYNNRIVFGMLNVRNQSSEAERIGREQLKQFLLAINVQSISSDNLNDLVGKTLKIRVKIREANGNYDATNTVNGFKKSDAVASVQLKPAVNNTPVNNIKPAWMK